jgi:hypothetical protein
MMTFFAHLRISIAILYVVVHYVLVLHPVRIAHKGKNVDNCALARPPVLSLREMGDLCFYNARSGCEGKGAKCFWRVNPVWFPLKGMQLNLRISI